MTFRMVEFSGFSDIHLLGVVVQYQNLSTILEKCLWLEPIVCSGIFNMQDSLSCILLLSYFVIFLIIQVGFLKVSYSPW